MEKRLMDGKSVWRKEAATIWLEAQQQDLQERIAARRYFHGREVPLSHT